MTIVSTSPNLWAANHSKGDQSMTIDKPFLALQLDFAGCSYEPKVNGVDFKDMLGGTDMVTHTKIPINQWLKPGKNTISLTLWPGDGWENAYKHGQKCDARMSLQVKQAKAPVSDYKTVEQIKFKSSLKDITPKDKHLQGTTPEEQLASYDQLKTVDSGGKIHLGPVHVQAIQTDTGPGVKITREINIPLPFPKWVWFDGEKIPDNNQTKQELFKKYKQIWKALNTQDFSQIKDWFNQRDTEISQAFYLDDQKTTIPDMKKEAANPNTELGGPLKPEYMHVVRKADGRLAALVANTDGEGCIFFNNKKTDMNSTYDMWFMKKDGGWKVIR